jgi:hypothetical protein
MSIYTGLVSGKGFLDGAEPFPIEIAIHGLLWAELYRRLFSEDC